MKRPEPVRIAQKREAFEALAAAIVNARRACDAADGIETLSPYLPTGHPPKILARPSQDS